LRRPEDRLLVAMDTFAQKHVDQILIGNARLFCQPLEIVDGLDLDANGDLLLEHAAVWILPRFAEVVFFSHGRNSSYCCRSRFVAFRAEMMRISASSDL